MNKDRFYRTYPIFGCTLFLIAVLVPLCMALVLSVITSQGIEIQSLVRTFTDKDCLMTMAFSTLLALGCTTVCTLLGWFGASLLVRYHFTGTNLLKGLFIFAILLPAPVSALGIRLLLGQGGYLNQLYGIPAVTNGIALVFSAFVIFLTPLEILLISYYWKRLDYRCEQAARTLGVSKGKAFRTVSLPRLRPAIVAASSLVFLACLTGFSTIVMLDVNMVYSTAYAQIFRSLQEPSVASCYAIFNLVLGFAVLAIFCTMQRKMAKRITADASCHREPTEAKGFLSNAAIVVFTLLSLLLILTPIICVIANAIYNSNEGFLLTRIVELFNGIESLALLPLLYSLAIAVVSAMIAAFIARALSIAIYRKPNGKVSNGLFSMLPLCMGAVTFGFGFKVLGSYIPQIPDIAFVTLSHIAMLTPITVMLVGPVLSAIRTDLVPASRTLGYHAAATYKSIEKPAIRPAIAAGILFGFAISIGDIANALTIAGNDAKTIAVLLYTQYAKGNLSCASALGCVLIILCFIAVLVGEKLLRRCHV